LGSTRTAPSSAKPSPSDDEIVELRPPAEYGFSGTHKVYRIANAKDLAFFLERGYTIVEPKDPAA